MRMKKKIEIEEKWVNIRYDYVLKYCKTCKLHGHNGKECCILKFDLYPKEEEEDNKEKIQEEEHHGKREKLSNEEDRKTLEDKGKKKIHNEFQE